MLIFSIYIFYRNLVCCLSLSLALIQTCLICNLNLCKTTVILSLSVRMSSNRAAARLNLIFNFNFPFFLLMICMVVVLLRTFHYNCHIDVTIECHSVTIHTTYTCNKSLSCTMLCSVSYLPTTLLLIIFLLIIISHLWQYRYLSTSQDTKGSF